MPVVPVGFNRPASQTNCPERLQLLGPTVGVQIGFDPNYDGKNLNVIPAVPADLRNALIDTGASHNSIDDDLARQLNLPIIDKKPVSGVHGSIRVEICSAQIYLPQFNFTIYGPFALVKLRAGGQPHDALLGRNLLRFFVFHYDRMEGYARLIR